MTLEQSLEQDWQTLCQMLPGERDAAAKRTGALLRRREIQDIDTLLRMALVYSWAGLSLRGTVQWASQKGLASLSDVALLERLQKCAPFLHWLLSQMLTTRLRSCLCPTLREVPYKVRLVDATSIGCPGTCGTDWRVHMGLNLHEMRIDSLEITDRHGGESLTRFDVEPGDVLVGDRGYAHRAGIAHVLSQQGHVLVRMNWQNLPLEHPNGTAFDLMAALASLGPDELGDWPVQTAPDKKRGIGALAGRLVACRKDAAGAQQARKQALAQAKKNKNTIHPNTLISCEFMFVFTTLPADVADAATVLKLYRFRWQIECGFKRLKGLLEIDALKATEPRLCQSFLLCKLIGALLAEDLAFSWSVFSPWDTSGSADNPFAAARLGPRRAGSGVDTRTRGHRLRARGTTAYITSAPKQASVKSMALAGECLAFPETGIGAGLLSA